MSKFLDRSSVNFVLELLSTPMEVEALIEHLEDLNSADADALAGAGLPADGDSRPITFALRLLQQGRPVAEIKDRLREPSALEEESGV